MLGLSLVVVRNKEGKFLAVKELGNKGWWLPAGKVDPPEDYLQAAIRETKEEAGIDVQIKGLLRIEQNMSNHRIQRVKMVFYAEPVDESQVPKQIEDSESQEARWVSLKEMQKLGEEPPYLRGTELLEFGKYLEEGGIVYSLDVFQQEKVTKIP